MKKTNRSLIAFFFLSSILFIIYLNFTADFSGDDGWFRDVPREKSLSLIEFIQFRYTTWSSRIIPETILYYLFHIPLLFWRLMSVGALLLTSFSIVRIFNEKVEIKDMFSVVLIIFYLSYGTLFGSIFWITGSVNYLWPIAIGLYSMIPFSDSYYRDKPYDFNAKNLLFLVTAFLFSFSNEQFLLCGLGVSIIYFIAMFIKKRKITFLFILQSLMMFLGLLTMLLAPGNKVRFAKEIKNWYPNFNDYSTLAHFKLGSYWLVEQIHLNLIFLFIIIAIFSFLLLKNNYLKFGSIAFFILLSSLYLLSPTTLTNFELIKNYGLGNLFLRGELFSFNGLLAVFPYVMWLTFYILCITISIIVAKNKILISLCYTAGICACMIMFFSPTILASGPRVLFCFGIFLSIIAFYLLDMLLKETKLHSYYLILLSIFPILNFFIGVL